MTAREDRSRPDAAAPIGGRRQRSGMTLRITARGRLVLAALGAALAVALIAIVGALGRSAPARVARASPEVPRSAPVSPARGAPIAASATPAASGPSKLALSTIAQGRLPQTSAYPSGASRHFKELMAALWSGIVHDSVTDALPAFFPKGAYSQLKAIYGADSDWSGRLVHDYRLDIEAAHALLGSGARTARLVAVDVPSSYYGHWVPPGVCYNSIGYYEMPNARIVYSRAGATRSLGIASMISWRGSWYVVHLGAVLRSEDVGVVDAPESGRGTSQYSGTC